MRWTLAMTALVLVGLAAPAIGSFHETVGVVPDRVFVLALQGTSINGLHAPDAPLLEAYRGEKVRFAVAAAESHTFHLHGHPWLVETRIVDTFLVDPDTPHAFDVFAGGVDGQTGDWMYHCHIDAHMAEGMWGIFRVYPFKTRIESIGDTVDVALDALGEPLDGAQLWLAVDGEDVPAHVDPLGHGEYRIHTALPASGALVITATHPELGTSVARAGLGGVELGMPTLSVSHTH